MHPSATQPRTAGRFAKRQPAADTVELTAAAPGPKRDVPAYPDAHDSFWTSGGCGAFAAAMTQMWPGLKLAVEVYNDHGGESVAHVWAYDGEQKYDIYGSEPWTPSTDPDYAYDSTRVVLDVSVDAMDGMFHRGAQLGSVWDAFEVIDEMFA